MAPRKKSLEPLFIGRQTGLVRTHAPVPALNRFIKGGAPAIPVNSAPPKPVVLPSSTEVFQRMGDALRRDQLDRKTEVDKEVIEYTPPPPQPVIQPDKAKRILEEMGLLEAPEEKTLKSLIDAGGWRFSRELPGYSIYKNEATGQVALIIGGDVACIEERVGTFSYFHPNHEQTARTFLAKLRGRA